MYTEKSNVPRIEPCGTPKVILVDNLSTSLCSCCLVQQLFQSTAAEFSDLSSTNTDHCISVGIREVAILSHMLSKPAPAN